MLKLALAIGVCACGACAGPFGPSVELRGQLATHTAHTTPAWQASRRTYAAVYANLGFELDAIAAPRPQEVAPAFASPRDAVTPASCALDLACAWETDAVQQALSNLTFANGDTP